MKSRKATIVVLLLLGLFITPVNAAILEVGNNKSYQRVEQAAAVALPGDTILIYPGIYSGGDIIKNLHGKSEAWITILAKKDEEVIFRGGAEALHFTNISFIKIEGLTFEQQTGNGVNIDDGGDAANPSHHIRFERCYWRNMNAKGNNDQLKLSGVDASVAAIRFAEQNSAGYNIQYMQTDVLGDELKPDQFDIVISGLFSHHFPDEEWVRLIGKMQSCARRGVILTDLHRHRILYYAVILITHLFTRNKMVRIDGPLSVKRAFRRAELEKLLKQAGIVNYNLTWVWPFRWLLVIYK